MEFVDLYITQGKKTSLLSHIYLNWTFFPFFPYLGHVSIIPAFSTQLLQYFSRLSVHSEPYSFCHFLPPLPSGMSLVLSCLVGEKGPRWA